MIVISPSGQTQDGVLNCEHSTSRFGIYVGCDADKIERLKHIINLTDAKIVLSSSWRLDVSRSDGEWIAAGIYQYLIENLQKWHLEIYDITPDFKYKRGKEIHTWLKDHKDLGITDWVVLDDEWFPDFGDLEYDIANHLVQTCFYTRYGSLYGGLQDKDVDKAVYILEGGTSDGYELLHDNEKS